MTFCGTSWIYWSLLYWVVFTEYIVPIDLLTLIYFLCPAWRFRMIGESYLCEYVCFLQCSVPCNVQQGPRALHSDWWAQCREEILVGKLKIPHRHTLTECSFPCITEATVYRVDKTDIPRQYNTVIQTVAVFSLVKWMSCSLIAPMLIINWINTVLFVCGRHCQNPMMVQILMDGFTTQTRTVFQLNACITHLLTKQITWLYLTTFCTAWKYKIMFNLLLSILVLLLFL